jgi:hypothetical protein
MRLYADTYRYRIGWEEIDKYFIFFFLILRRW